MSRKGMGSIRQRSDGRWEGRYTDPTGVQRSVYGKTQKEAARRLKAAMADVDAGSWLKPDAITVGAWLDLWLKDCQGHTAIRTKKTYRFVVDKRLVPVLGAVRLQDLSPVHVRRLFTSMAAQGLSEATIVQARAVLTCAMKCAVQARLIREDPCRGVKVKRPSSHHFTVIDRPMIAAFVKAAQASTHFPDALVFMLQTGLRAGEVCGLRWSDVDLDAGTLRVERQLYAPNKAGRTFCPPKDGSARDIVLAPHTVALLRSHRVRQLAQRLERGWVDDPITQDLVFRQPTGANLTQSLLFVDVRRLRGPLGLPDLRPHDLRHSYAVAALRSGIDVKTVQHNLGHKSAAITLDIYADYTDDAGHTAARQLAAYWQSAISSD